MENSFNHYKRVDDLENRLNNKVSNTKELLKFWEKFDRSNKWEEEYFSKQDIYCSNNLYDIDNIKYIINETWIDNFNRFRKNKNNIDIESFSMLLISTWVKCIIVDNAEIDFLNPMREFDDFWFYEKSRLQYLIDSIFLQKFLISLSIYLLFVYIIYYKIILYIVYWKKN